MEGGYCRQRGEEGRCAAEAVYGPVWLKGSDAREDTEMAGCEEFELEHEGNREQ